MSLVHGIDTMDSYDDSTNIVAWMDRPFKCTCCCLARPELTVYWGTLDNTSNVIGKVLEPCTCIEIQMDLVDNASNSRFNIVADGCQCGICCRGSPCGRCSEVVFPIYKSSTQVKELGNCSGNIKRLFPGCLKSVATDADNFDVVFPIDASPEDKMMMIATALMIDYRFYNEGPDDNQV